MILEAGLVGGALAFEIHTSWLQSKVLTAAATRITFSVQHGLSPSASYPTSGPYDARLGYSDLPDYLGRLDRAGFEVAAQARTSSASSLVTKITGAPIYREKPAAGLQVLDRKAETLFMRRYPERIYPDFEAIPPAVVRTLLFIENRELLDATTPRRNPAVEWDRLSGAVGGFLIHWLRPGTPLAGGSTLATQLEKVRHSPGGRTTSIADKARQMASASVRAYLDGEQTLAARKRIVRDYLNSLPLASRQGYGEICGLGDGLWAWFGADFVEINRLLFELETNTLSQGPSPQHAEAYGRVLTLLLATKKPSLFLNEGRGELSRRTESYLRLLSDAGVISTSLRDTALHVPIAIPTEGPGSGAVDFAQRKAVDAIRVELMRELGLTRLYDLDRLDLIVETTLDEKVTVHAGQLLNQLSNPNNAVAAGLTGERLLNPAKLAPVIYSFTMYERVPTGNQLRVHVDNLDAPLNINEGTKLELGSTAKLRTLVSYLEVVAELHTRLSLPSSRREVTQNDRQGVLSLWAEKYWARADDKSLPAMLDAAMNRTYSASPGEPFFTGGGLHQFQNFDAKNNGRILTVRDAFQRSVNLPFIRLMRDLVEYHTYRTPGASPSMVKNQNDPMRGLYLSRFADEEGIAFLRRFYRKYAGQHPESPRALLTKHAGMSDRQLAVIHRSVRPEAGFEEFAAFMTSLRPGIAVRPEALRDLYHTYSRERHNLNDRAYLARAHPLELWLVEYLSRHTNASFAEVIKASAAERQQAYTWLLRSTRKHAQDVRIRSLLEADAFREIHQRWQRLGYPFPSLTPSLATAIGSSADTPKALAELVGIVLNGGRRFRLEHINALRFAEGTPYETIVERTPQHGEIVLLPTIAQHVKQELIGVVEKGTGRRAFGSVTQNDGKPLPIGGKTGTGDNRVHMYGVNRSPAGSTPMNRTSAFVFIIGDRFFGTVLAYVPGSESAEYHFTSALAVQLFRQLVPVLRPLFDS
jgi:membrane peptidoglycan carboxypeptidase